MRTKTTTKQLIDELITASRDLGSIESRHSDCDMCGFDGDDWVPCSLGADEEKAGQRVSRAMRALVRALKAKETK